MAKTSGVRQRLTLAAACGAAMLLAGCVSNPAYQNPRDPLEALNRGIFQFNEEVDNLILKPIAKGYQAITPDPVDRGVTNFFDNIADVRNAVNNALQFKMTRAVTSVGRILVNSTVGVLGFADVASNMNLPKYNEDFGQTLGTWGVGPGPFIVLPFLGPSTGRDTVGLVADWYTDPLTYVNDGGVAWGVKGLRIIDRRADLLAASRVLDEAALDPYSFVRDAFLQRRHSDIHDGNPPPEPEELDDADEADAAAATPAN